MRAVGGSRANSTNILRGLLYTSFALAFGLVLNQFTWVKRRPRPKRRVSIFCVRAANGFSQSESFYRSQFRNQGKYIFKNDNTKRDQN